MSDIVIIGNLEEILPFKAIGLAVCPMDEMLKEKKTNEIFKHVFEQPYKIIFISEQYYDEFTEIYNNQKMILKEHTPVIMPITNGIEFKDIGRKLLKSLVERAIGVDIFKEK